MKPSRFLLTAALTLMLLFAVRPTASADIIYPGPASIEAGSYLNHLVATVQADAALSYVPGALPPGVEFVSEQGLDGINVYLRGTPMLAGNYNCTLSIDDGSALCPLTVTPAMPVVTSTGNVTCLPGQTAQVAVNAYTTDGGSLSYQWYYSQSGTNTFGYEIPGETQPFYDVGTAYSGVSYYYCVVTNTNNGYALSTASPAIAVTVSESSIASVSLLSIPYTTSYTVGDVIDTTGLQLAVTYSDGSVQYLSQGFAITPAQVSVPGTQPIAVDYQGFSSIFYVTVQEQADSIDGLGVLTLPYKIRYTAGETLDTAGLTVRVYTSRGVQDIGANDVTCSPTVLNDLGEQTIYVFYGDQNCTFTVTVEEPEHPVSLVVATMPNKTTYTVGDSLEITGLTLRQISSRQNSETIYTGFTCFPTQLTTVGRQEITVSYGGLSARFTVTVTEAFAPTPTPIVAPTPSYQPVTQPTAAPSAMPLPSSTPVMRSSHSAHQSNLGRSLIGVIVMAAVVALVILAIYVYLLNRGYGSGRSRRHEDNRQTRRMPEDEPPRRKRPPRT